MLDYCFTQLLYHFPCLFKTKILSCSSSCRFAVAAQPHDALLHHVRRDDGYRNYYCCWWSIDTAPDAVFRLVEGYYAYSLRLKYTSIILFQARLPRLALPNVVAPHPPPSRPTRRLFIFNFIFKYDFNAPCPAPALLCRSPPLKIGQVIVSRTLNRLFLQKLNNFLQRRRSGTASSSTTGAAAGGTTQQERVPPRIRTSSLTRYG